MLFFLKKDYSESKKELLEIKTMMAEMKKKRSIDR